MKFKAELGGDRGGLACFPYRVTYGVVGKRVRRRP